MLLLFTIRILNNNLFRKELLDRFTVRVLRERLSICVCASFTFGSEGGMWDSIVLVHDHYLSFYFTVWFMKIPSIK